MLEKPPDYYAASYDIDSGITPTVCFAILTTPRVGSTLLAWSLAQTGTAAIPIEYLNPIHRKRLSKRWKAAPNCVEYLERLQAKRTSPQGIFGFKCHALQALGKPEMKAALTAICFHDYRLIRVSREDKVAQAVSLAHAVQTGRWNAAVDFEKGAADYDKHAIDAALTKIEAQEALWDAYLRSVPSQNVLNLTHEEIIRDYNGTVRRALDHIGLQGDIPRVPPSARENSAIKQDWAAQYRRDALEADNAQ